MPGTGTDPISRKKLRVKTEDGATDVLGVHTIEVTDLTLTNEGGGVVSIDTGGGGGGGSIGGTISAPQVAYATGTDTIGGVSGFEYDATNNLLAAEKSKTQVIIEVENDSASAIPAGTPVYITTTVGGGGRPRVLAANASAAGTMPSLGIVTNQIGGGAGTQGYVAISGALNGLSTVSGAIFDSAITTGNLGDVVYVSTTTGKLTVTKPNTVAGDYIQNVGRIVGINGGNCKMQISNIGRFNDVPNTFSIVGDMSTTASVGAGIASPSYPLEVVGLSATDGRIHGLTGSSANPITLTAATSNEVIFSQTAGATINLPNAAPDGLKYTIKDVNGSGGQSITPQAGQAIELPGGGLGPAGAPWPPLSPWQAQDFIAWESNWYLV